MGWPREPEGRTTAGVAGPFRTCIGCRRTSPPDRLVRVVRRPDGGLSVGRSLPGRGAWLCAGSTGCLELAARRRGFDRALRAPISPEAIEELRARLAGL